MPGYYHADRFYGRELLHRKHGYTGYCKAAANMGYGACYMTGPVHSRDKIYEVMGHDETKGELMALIPVGGPEDSSAPQPPRLPLEDVVTFID